MENKAFREYVEGLGTYQDAAAHLGLSKAMVGSICRGSRACNVDLARRIEEETGGRIKRLALLYPSEIGQ